MGAGVFLSVRGDWKPLVQRGERVMRWVPGEKGRSLPGLADVSSLPPSASRVLTWVDRVRAPGSIGGRSHRGQRRQQQQQQQQKPGFRARSSHGQQHPQATPGPATGLSSAPGFRLWEKVLGKGKPSLL